jgi:hypothetical protein
LATMGQISPVGRTRAAPLVFLRHQAGKRNGFALPSRSRRTIAHRRSLLRPPSFAAGHRDPDRSLYWRSRRDLLLDLYRGRSAGARVLRRCSWHRWIGLLPADRPVLPVYVRLARNTQKGTGWVERSDTHHLLPLSKNPAIMRDIACPILGIDAELHHAME